VLSFTEESPLFSRRRFPRRLRGSSALSVNVGLQAVKTVAATKVAVAVKVHQTFVIVVDEVIKQGKNECLCVF
jgi:hypothetical protein